MNTAEQKPSRSPGMLPTLTITALLAVIVFSLFFLKEKQPNVAEESRKNELQAYEHMRQLITAQAEYIKTDHDGNGTLEYARFIPHLWRSIGENNEKIQVNLLPKKTAFAIKRLRSIDGYYFIHKFTKPDPQAADTKIDLDAATEWGALMIPAEDNSGFLTFFADQTGCIYVNHGKDRQTIPDEPAADEGWILLKDIEQLKAVQQQIFGQ